MFSVEDEKYLVHLVKEIVEYREKNNIMRNDFIDLLLQMKNKGSIGEDMKDKIECPFGIINITTKLKDLKQTALI